MIKEFEEELKKLLLNSNLDIETAKSYLGEFDNPNQLESYIKGKPIVMIDFTGDKHPSIYNKDCFFSLYIVDTVSNKNDTYRDNNRFNLISLIEKIDNLLEGYSISDSGPIKLNSLDKIFDGPTRFGYMIVYVRKIIANFQKV